MIIALCLQLKNEKFFVENFIENKEIVEQNVQRKLSFKTRQQKTENKNQKLVHVWLNDELVSGNNTRQKFKKFLLSQQAMAINV